MLIIQDADLEYDPADYPKLIEPILNGRADVVFGSRFAGGEPHRVLYFWHYLAEPRAHAALQYAHQSESHGHGGLLQGLSPRDSRADRDRRGSLRLRARDHRQGREARLPHLRGRHLLQPVAPTKMARRSAGATALPPCAASSSTTCCASELRGRRQRARRAPPRAARRGSAGARSRRAQPPALGRRARRDGPRRIR